MYSFFVKQQHAGPGRERHRDFELAMLTMAEIGDRNIRARAETGARKRGASRCAQSFLAARRTPEFKRMPIMRLNRERDIVEHAHVEKQ